MNEKLGHQAPRGYVFNRYFNYVYIKGDLHYCASHDFVFDCEEQERKLYNAEPCYYTDARYISGRGNYYKDCYLYESRSRWGKKYGLSLKACMRLVERCRNIPVGTIVEFRHDWFYKSKKGSGVIPTYYKYKVRNENPFDPEYEINMAKYERNFDNDKWAQELTNELRANGFIVGVSKGNPNFIMSMIGTAQEYTGRKRDADRDEEGQIATAYGHGMIVGFSTGDDTYRGYSNGRTEVLFDYHGEFNKWSQCLGIEKSVSPKEIVAELLKPRDNE